MNSTTLGFAAVGATAIFVTIFALIGGTDADPDAHVLERLDEASQFRMAIQLDDDVFEVNREARSPGQALRALLSRMGGSKVDKSKRGNKLKTKLLAAGLKIRPAEWIAISAGVGLGLGGLTYLRFGSPIAFAIALVVGYAGAQFNLKRLAGKRRRRFDVQLGPSILSISNGVKAGYTFAQAIDLVGKHAPAPIGPELMRVTRETQLGVPIGEALGHMVVRNYSEDLKLMHTAVQIQQQVGGNLAGILDSIEYTIRERVRIKGEIKTLTGQARASGWILIVLPFALGGILEVIAPSYFKPMVTTGIGQGMLGVAGFCLLCGYGIIQKIVNVKV